VPQLQRVGNLNELAFGCNIAGYAAIAEERYDEALQWLGRGLDANRELRLSRAHFVLHGNRGLVKLFLNDLDDAEREFALALAICQEAAAEQTVDEIFLALAVLASRRGRFAAAAWFTGAAHGHRFAARSVDDETVWRRMEAEAASVRDRCGHATWDDEERRGRSLSLREAIEQALAELASMAAAGQPST
jgi:hypothetical protein